MATTIDSQPEARSLEDELQELARDENDLDDRASSLELRTILIALLAGAALVFSVAALAVALIRTGGSSNTSGAGTAAAAPQAGSGAAAATPAPMNMALPVKNVKLAIKADAKRGSDGKTHDAFFPTTNLSVKAGQRVRVVISNYDDMPHSFTSPALPKGAQIPVGEQQTQGTPQDLKVMPLPGVGFDKMVPAGSDKRPSKTILMFTAPAKPGSYIWYCKLPCDAWAMSHAGYMIGRVKVTAA